MMKIVIFSNQDLETQHTYLGLRVSSPVISIHDFYFFIKMIGWRISLIHPNVLGTRHAEGWKFSEYTVYLSIFVCVVARQCIQRTFLPLRAAFREQLRIREHLPRTLSIYTYIYICMYVCIYILYTHIHFSALYNKSIWLLYKYTKRNICI